MQELKSKAEDLTESIGNYLNTYIKLKVLDTADKATTLGASVMAGLICIFLGIFVLFFSGIALAIWLGGLLESAPLGYLLVAGFYLLIIFILIAFRKKIIFPMIRNSLISKLYEPGNQDVQ